MHKIKTLSDVVAQIESGNNPHAIRYEPQWHYFAEPITRACQVAHKCNETTARMILSCSWGKYQIMGQVIYEGGYRGNILTDFMNRDIPQDIAFDNFIRSRDIRFTIEQLLLNSAREYFARRYNGPGNVLVYSNKIAKVLTDDGYILKD